MVLLGNVREVEKVREGARERSSRFDRQLCEERRQLAELRWAGLKVGPYGQFGARLFCERPYALDGLE